MNNDSIDSIDASMLRLNTLEKEYDVILKQYEEAYNNYISDVNESTEKRVFRSLPGRAWWGANGLKESVVSTKEECESMCASDINCTGATFNSDKKYCWTRTGNGILTKGKDEDVAIIPKLKSDIIILTSLNKRLVSINKSIQDELSVMNPQIEETQKENDIKMQKLKEYYNQLADEKDDMDKLIKKYSTIEEGNENEELYVNKENISYKNWTLIALVLFAILLNLLVGNSIITIFVDLIVGIIIFLMLLS
jgi:hypothetical protein